MLQNKVKASVKWVMLGLALLLILAGCGNDKEGSSSGDSGKVVATYKDGKVTEKQLSTFMGAHKFFNYNEMYSMYESLPDFKESMLRQLIAIRLMTEDLARKEKDASADKAKQDMDEMDKSIKSNEENKTQFDKLMDELQINSDDLKNFMISQYNLQKVFQAKYSDEEVRKKYDENLTANKDAYTIATVRHILVSLSDDQGKEIRTKEEALKRAQEAQQKLKNGGDWVALAKEYSDDPGSKDNGGQYLDTDVTQWVENFKKNALEQPLNEVGEPFETDFGYHVMVVEKRSTSEFETVKDQVRSAMINDFFGNYIDVEVPKLAKIDLPKPEEEAPVEDSSDKDTGSDTDAETGNDAAKNDY